MNHLRHGAADWDMVTEVFQICMHDWFICSNSLSNFLLNIFYWKCVKVYLYIEKVKKKKKSKVLKNGK